MREIRTIIPAAGFSLTSRRRERVVSRDRSKGIAPPLARRRGSFHARGFTLIEALLAGMILALAALAIAGGVITSMQSLQTARAYQEAAGLLDRTMTKIDMVGPERVSLEGPLQGRFDPPYDRYTWEAVIQPLADHYLYEVRIEVSWPESGGQRSAVLHTYLDDPPGSRDPAPAWEDL